VCPACDDKTLVSCPEEARAYARTLTVHELFLVWEGLGLPEERDPLLVDVARHLASGIKRPRLHQADGGVFVDSLECQDGHTLFFASSVHGALCYRVRPPRKKP
jgi:hypothetical protein